MQELKECLLPQAQSSCAALTRRLKAYICYLLSALINECTSSGLNSISIDAVRPTQLVVKTQSLYKSPVCPFHTYTLLLCLASSLALLRAFFLDAYPLVFGAIAFQIGFNGNNGNS